MRIGIDARELCGRPTGVGRYLSGQLAEWAVDNRAREHEFVLYAPEPLTAALDARRFATRIVPGPGGLPVQGPSDGRDWSLTQPSFELGTGVSIKAGERLSIRPEFRWLATTGQDSNPRSTLEPPLLFLRGGVTLEWRLR